MSKSDGLQKPFWPNVARSRIEQCRKHRLCSSAGQSGRVDAFSEPSDTVENARTSDSFRACSQSKSA